MRRRTVLCALSVLLFGLGLSRGAYAGETTPAATSPTAAPSASPATPPGAAKAAVDDPLLRQIDEAVQITKQRTLDGRVHTPWQIVHGIVGLRQDFVIKIDGRTISALDWLSKEGATYQGESYFLKTEFGAKGHPFTKPMYFEGHPQQFLAYMSICKLPLDYPIQVGDESLTIGDIVRDAQQQVRTGDEPTWTLWALSTYLPVDATWENKQKEPWSIERLVRSQNYQPVTTAACGGTHGLFALTWARNQYLKTGQPLRGVWLEADQKIRRYLEEARTLQSADGSFSVDFFKGRRAGRDVKERLGPSGHTTEFVVLALPDERLNEPWVRKAITSVTRDLLESRSQALDPAPLYHAVDGLILYRDRIQALNARPTTPAVAGQSNAVTTPANGTVGAVTPKVAMPK